MSSIILEKGDDKQIIELGPSFGIFLLGPFYLCVLRRWKDAGIVFLIYSIFINMYLLGMLPNRDMLLETFWWDMVSYLSLTIAPAGAGFILERLLMKQEIFLLVEHIPVEAYPSVFLFLLGTLGIIILHILTSLFYNKIYCKRILQRGYKSIENDKYSQQILEYYQKHSFF